MVANAPYEKMDGNYFASFIRANFETMFLASGKNKHLAPGQRPVTEQCGRVEMDEIGAELFPIPPHSPGINLIDNFFYLVRRKLTKVAIEKNITLETINDFEARVIQTMHEMPLEQINNMLTPKENERDYQMLRRTT